MELGLALLVVLGITVAAGWLARRKGRSVVGWVILALFFHLIALAVLLVMPHVRLTCPNCAHPYTRGDAVCESCGSALPPEGVADRLTPGDRYDKRCPNCEAPYRLDDYRPDAAHIYCSTCRAELPRDPATGGDGTLAGAL